MSISRDDAATGQRIIIHVRKRAIVRNRKFVYGWQASFSEGRHGPTAVTRQAAIDSLLQASQQYFAGDSFEIKGENG